MFKIEIKTEDDALSGPQAAWELADILRGIAQKVADYQTSGVIYDSNGNAVGVWSWL